MGQAMGSAAPTPPCNATWFSNLRKDSNMASQNVLEFTSDNWQQEVEQSEQTVLVDFWAPWCGPCRALTPIIDRIAAQFVGKVKVGKLNVDDAPDVASKFGVTSIPRIFIFKGGDKPRRSIVGLTSENELVKALNSVIEQ
jgi:thioredoxin 1